MSFLFQSLLTIGLPLIGLPLLIHLINLRRRQRIEWAAMDFLLESQKRNKTWVVLKQFMLLLLRTAAVALAVFMLAGPVVRSGWASLFGRGMTHHLILLDDSYSMSDRWEESSALEEAKRAVMRILDQARGRADNQAVTLLLFSEASRMAAGSGATIDRRPLDAEAMTELERYLSRLLPSETGAGPVEALQAATRLPEPAVDETRIAYLVSDFRRPQWQKQAALRQLTSRLRQRSAKLLLVQSVYAERPNLAVTRLAPESGIRAAGVETPMEVAVANYGAAAVHAVTINIEQDGARLPAVAIDEIPAGEEATGRFRVTFPEAGSHQIAASLESDAVEADNVRYFAAEIPPTFPVLLVDGSAEGDDGYFLRTALSPGGRNRGGWSPQVEPPSFLRQHERLADFAAICLLDVPRLDDPEIAALEAYVGDGGGLALFLGDRVQRDFYNQSLYRNGAGLLPAPLDVPTQLLVDSQAAADVQVTDHPVFDVFAGQRNSFLNVAKFNFYHAIDPQWTQPESGEVRTIARLRNGAPLSLEKKLGAGRVIAHLAKLSPRPTELGAWSNWAINPVFPVYANELIGYLSAARRRFDVQEINQPTTISVPEAEYQPDARVRPPRNTGGGATVAATAKNGQLTITAPDKPRSGVWAFDLKTRDGKEQTKLVAVNVPVGEGRLQIADREALAEALRGIDYQYALASEFDEAHDDLAGFRLADTLLYMLAGALIIEQLVAVSASYHPAGGRRSA
ncbi:MAG: hypothetical protein DCC67_05780 [Planctomycetota bacterium]|nr:MAG: hypothetical protein DCC67_05780 [Planctomycetota bacterium]